MIFFLIEFIFIYISFDFILKNIYILLFHALRNIMCINSKHCYKKSKSILQRLAIYHIHTSYTSSLSKLEFLDTFLMKVIIFEFLSQF